MAVRLYSEFKSDNGKQYKIEIHDANWLAVATEFNVDSNGFELTYEGETDDIVSPIVGSKVSFGAYSADATFETFINTLRTFQENRFRVVVKKYNGTSYDLYWAGWVMQDLVNIEDESQPYIYQISASDGIGRLANLEYNFINGETAGVTKVPNIIGNCLSLLEVDDFWGAGETYLRTSVDWWETTSQTYSTTKDTLSEHAIDMRVFLSEDENGTTIYSKAIDVLKELAITYGARFYQSNGRYVFEQYVNRSSATRYVTNYDNTITKINTTSVNDDVTIDQTNGFARLSGGQFTYLPAVGSVSVEYARDKFSSTSKPYTFRSTAPTKTLGIIGASTSTQLKFYGPHNYNITSSSGLGANDGIIAVVWRMEIRIESATTPGLYYYYKRAFNGFNANSIYGPASWSTTAGYYYYHSPFAKVIFDALSLNTAPVVVTANLPVSGTLRVTAQHYANYDPSDGTQYVLEPHQTDTWEITLTIARMDNSNDDSVSVIYRAENTNPNVDSKIELSLGTTRISNGLFQTGDLSVFNGSNWVSGVAFRRGSTGAGNQILNLLTAEMVGLHAAPIKRFNGDMFNDAPIESRLTFDGNKYVNMGGSFFANNDNFSGEWFAIAYDNASVGPLDEIAEPAKLTIQGGSNIANTDDVLEVGRVGGMVVDVEEQRIGPFEQLGSSVNPTGGRITGTMNVTGDVTLDAGLDVDGVSQFNNDVNITGSVTSTGPLTGEYVQLDTTYNTTPVQGQIVWSTDDGTIDVGLNSNVVMQVGQEQFWYVKNQTGSTITKGTAVRAAGTLGASGRILAAPMIADGSVPARFLLGIAAENIVDGGEGYVTTFGKIRQLNTSAFTEGSVLWCNPAVAGGLTATEPSAPNLKLAVAFVVRSDSTSGVLAVRSEIGTRVADASDVQVTSVADNDLLQYNTTTSRWENVAGTTTNIGEGTNLYYTDARSRAAISETIDGISYNNTTGVFSLDANRVIVTTTQTSEWDTAYNDRIVSAAVSGTTTKTLTLTQGDGGTITASWTDYDTAPVTSVNGQTGVVVLTTDNINEGTSNLYYTDGRARASLSAGTGITYNNTTGVITNAAPDQVVALTASTAIAVTGTYPNFTIENTAPDQVVALTASTGISVTGTYPNFTITNTAPSSGGTITGGGTTNYLSKWTGASALGDSLVFDNGTNVGIGTTSPAQKLQVAGSIALNSVTNGTSRYYTYPDANHSWYYDDNIVGSSADVMTYYENFLVRHQDTTNVFLINGSGNVGIGTTAPGQKLHVDGALKLTSNPSVTADGSAAYFWNQAGVGPTIGGFKFQVQTNGSSVAMVVDENQRVGIGTTSPSAKLDVIGTARILAADAPTSSELTAKILAYAPAPYGMVFRAYSSGTNSIQVQRESNDSEMFGLTLQPNGGNVGIGTTSPTAKLDVYNTSNAEMRISTASEGYLLLGQYTNGGFIGTSSSDATAGVLRLGTAGTERMRITAGGNVGIGTTDPSGGGVVGSKFTINVPDNETAFAVLNGTSRRLAINPITNGGFTIFDGGSSTWNAGIAQVNGNVGIGTTSPAYRFDVNGNGRFTNEIYVNGVWSTNYGPRSNGSPILFQDWNGGELMRISTTNGNVGIGTTAPVGKLSILVDGASTWSHYIQTPVTANKRNSIGFHDNTGVNIAAILTDINNDGTADFGISVPNGLPRLVIKSSGNVGIGTTSPSFPLSVAGKIGGTLFSDSHLEFLGSGNTILKANNDVVIGYSQSFYVTQGGNVGIGTTSPITKLDVRGQTYINNGASNALTIDTAVADSSTRDAIYLFEDDSQASGRQAISWYNGNQSYYKARIWTEVGGSYAATTFGIDVADDARNVATRLAIRNGNVGIGTTAPAHKLDVSGNVRIQETTNGGTLYFGSSAANYLSYDSTNAYFRANGIHYFEGGGFQKGVFDSSGNFGIGTTAPDKKLVVVGDGTGTAKIGVAGFTGGNYTGISFNGTLSEGNYNILSSPTDPTLYINRPSGYSIQFRETNAAQMIISSGGNVGIGTTAPGSLLQVGYQNSTTDSLIRLGVSYAGDRSARGGITWHDATNVTGKIFTEYDGSMVSMVFGSLFNSAYNSNQLMIIRGNGNVGIGTTSPSEKLHVDGNVVITYNNSYQGINSVGNKAILARVSPTTGIINYAEYATAANLNGFVIGSDDARVKGNIATDSLEFITNTSTRMFINSSGNVGIGTTSPARNLHVAGDVQFNDQGAIPAGQYVPDGAYGIDNLITNGAENVALGKPDVWLRIYVDGVAFVFPGYTE